MGGGRWSWVGVVLDRSTTGKSSPSFEQGGGDKLKWACSGLAIWWPGDFGLFPEDSRAATFDDFKAASIGEQLTRCRGACRQTQDFFSSERTSVDQRPPLGILCM